MKLIKFIAVCLITLLGCMAMIVHWIVFGY